MREHLIQILAAHPEEFIDDAEIAEYIVSRLRCDTCKHWMSNGPGVPGDCLHDDGMVNARAEDFCSRWEPKQ